MSNPGAVAGLFVAILFASGAGAQNLITAPPPSAETLPAPPLSLADGEAIERGMLAASEFAFPPQLEGAAADLASADPNLRDAADAVLSKAAIMLAADERGDLANPAAVDPNWALRGNYDPAADFAAARAGGRIGAWIDGVVRRDPGYIALVAALRRYQAIAVRGSWGALPPGLTLAPGAKGKWVSALRLRLAREGYAAGALANHLYDASLADAVREFQQRHALAASGDLDAATVQALNVPVAARIVTLRANLERARWLPQQLPADRIEADLGSATVTLFENGQPSLTMRAVVGDPKHPTPLFASHVASIQFNPAWHVPTDIAKAELWPKQARSPGYFARHGYAVVNGQLVQHAGPHSSLGRIKFEMPNQFAVYLHDTPGRALFAVDSRGRSHGCVRLEKPKELALALLASQGWTAERVQAAIDSGVTHWVRPAMATPVFIIDRTAEAPDDGPAIFRPDLYGWDGKLAVALASSQ
ncbi:MAG TPA: L,D-transpeptidase family protein [Caulobacteraceae bacterium]|nr:L,D-transpeptidase family protein [Caulobacteraceae bacterium]